MGQEYRQRDSLGAKVIWQFFCLSFSSLKYLKERKKSIEDKAGA